MRRCPDTDIDPVLLAQTHELIRKRRVFGVTDDTCDSEYYSGYLL